MPRAVAIIGEIGTSGRVERLELEGFRADVARAVELEHPCEDDSCDIAKALEAGYPLAAAQLLQGATETPLLDAVLSFYAAELEAEAAEDWRGWVVRHRELGVKCEACGSYTYGDDHYRPEQCGNCLAQLPPAPLSRDREGGFIEAWLAVCP